MGQGKAGEFSIVSSAGIRMIDTNFGVTTTVNVLSFEREFSRWLSDTSSRTLVRALVSGHWVDGESWEFGVLRLNQAPVFSQARLDAELLGLLRQHSRFADQRHLVLLGADGGSVSAELVIALQKRVDWRLEEFSDHAVGRSRLPQYRATRLDRRQALLALCDAAAG